MFWQWVPGMRAGVRECLSLSAMITVETLSCLAVKTAWSYLQLFFFTKHSRSESDRRQTTSRRKRNVMHLQRSAKTAVMSQKRGSALRVLISHRLIIHTVMAMELKGVFVQLCCTTTIRVDVSCGMKSAAEVSRQLSIISSTHLTDKQPYKRVDRCTFCRVISRWSSEQTARDIT